MQYTIECEHCQLFCEISLDKVREVYYYVGIGNEEVNDMKSQTVEIKSTPLKSSRELAKMLKSLPRDERLRIEGAIIWASVARQQAAQESA